MSERREPTVGDHANPFSGSRQGFFERGDRKTHLEQLRYASQWSRPVQLVTGPRGAGKSTLYRQLSASLEPRAQAARINGALVASASEVLYAMVQGFGLGVAASADLSIMRDAIANHARQQQRGQRLCVCLIDDADLLDPRAMEQLVTLVKSSPLRLVLFGEVRLVSALEKPLEQMGVAWYEIRLGGFDADDVAAYLDWRFRQAGYAGDLPFSDAEMQEIARLSEGLPGRIDQIANVLLAKLHSSERSLGGRFPARHRLALLGLLVVVGLVYLLWPGGGDLPSDTTQRVEPMALPRSPADADESPEPVRTPDREPAAAPAPQTAPAETVMDPPAVVTPEPAPESDPEPAPEPAPESDPEPAPPSPLPSPSRAAPSAPTAPADGRARDAAWILAQAPDSFTLQLVSLSSAERVQAYLADQADRGDFASYRLQRDGRILHVVIYGQYATRAEAEAAARTLPASVGAVQPWIRPFADVQAAVRTALQS
ncbi:MAG: AAA family ATPase [Pseudomonadales bacterium]